MNFRWKTLAVSFLLMCFGGMSLASAENVGLVDGLWVMKKVDDRYEGDVVQEDIRINLWRTRGEKEEFVHDMEVRWLKKKYGRQDRLIIHFLQPKFSAGITLLNIVMPYLDDERFMFFPEGPIIRRVRAVDEHTGFMGTDFSYYDLSEREPDEENHKLLRIEKFQGADCYVVETTPKGPVGAGYLRKLYWVDSERFIKLRIQYFHSNGRFWKQYDTYDWQTINDIWTPLKVTMEDYMKGHKTVIERSNVRFNQKVRDDLFNPQNIDGVTFNNGVFALIPYDKRSTRALKTDKGAQGGMSE